MLIFSTTNVGFGRLEQLLKQIVWKYRHHSKHVPIVHDRNWYYYVSVTLSVKV